MRPRRLITACCASTALALLLPATATAAPAAHSILPVGLLGIELPSVQGIVEAIANGFAQALAGALIPGFLKSATVATIQWLVALPDPATWTHIGRLQGQMTWLGISLMPVTLAIATIRYWTLGLSGTGHPAQAVLRLAGSCGLLVAYPWIIGQAVAATNTITHAILGFPEVANGLSSLVTVLFGGALLTGAGSAFAAILVIVGVVLAAAVFAMQAFLTLLLAVLVVSGPPLIALSPVPELSHLARGWARALGVIALIPICWTVLFATAGALTLDATSLSGGAGGLPGHITAAFAALATWLLAIRLPLMLLGELRGFMTSGFHRHTANQQGQTTAGRMAANMPGADRVRSARARLRAVASDGIPVLAGSAGMAAGALGAPAGGPVGALGRKIARPRSTATGAEHAATPAAQPSRPDGWRARTRRASEILASAPGQARDAIRQGAAADLAAQQAARRPGQPPPRRPAPVPEPPTSRKRAGAAGQTPRGPSAPTKPEREQHVAQPAPPPAPRPRPQSGREPAHQPPPATRSGRAQNPPPTPGEASSATAPHKASAPQPAKRTPHAGAVQPPPRNTDAPQPSSAPPPRARPSSPPPPAPPPSRSPTGRVHHASREPRRVEASTNRVPRQRVAPRKRKRRGRLP